ncbi:hypothetical protein [Haladaptatus sp. DJG-WS-42]|uniref:hypothetical protein n=1 Tax=Haladaptatus sp. DJG-WS-42 TaxID=3120516 RepID=UPI0030D2A978
MWLTARVRRREQDAKRLVRGEVRSDRTGHGAQERIEDAMRQHLAIGRFLYGSLQHI